MTKHINIEFDETTISHYTIHKDGLIAGFFGPYRFLSNFYPLEVGVVFDELYYPSIEHAYQAAKWPSNKREQFLTITARESKKLGRNAPDFNSGKWDKVKLNIMRSLCRQKFEKNIKLKQMLY
jgi:ribA/ribD-fused uncharacterized protein